MRRIIRASECGKKRRLPWKDCAGYIAAEYAYLYPPGIPVLVPGERIDTPVRDWLCQCQARRISVEGPANYGFLEVWSDE